MSKSNPLVLDGSEIKLRLEAERTAHQSPIHIDWLRFTCLLRNVTPDFKTRRGPVLPTNEVLGKRSFKSLMPFLDYRKPAKAAFSTPAIEDIHRLVRSTLEGYEAEHQSPEFQYAAGQALDLANECAEALGPDFLVSPELKPGKDFYKYRFIIEREGHGCGWVGFLAASNSPSAERQNQTIHVNLEGHACTFAAHGWTERFADIVDKHEAKITRADLALDFFDGMGMDFVELKDHYQAGAFDVRGARPSTKQAGDWFNGAERSLYIGCRKSGKETNVYEKGDQLFGREAKNPWVRIELRYGNKLRVLPSDILRRPADFFAGASDWHQLQLERSDSMAPVAVTPIPQEKKLPIQTVAAEVSRNLRWAITSAAPTIAAAFKYLSESEFLELCDWRTKSLPGRLRRFASSDLQCAFQSLRITNSLNHGAGHAVGFA